MVAAGQDVTMKAQDSAATEQDAVLQLSLRADESQE